MARPSMRLLARQQEHLGKALAAWCATSWRWCTRPCIPAQRKRLAELLADGTLAALFGRRPLTATITTHHHHQGC